MVATLEKWEGRLDMTTAKEINRTTKISPQKKKKKEAQGWGGKGFVCVI